MTAVRDRVLVVGGGSGIGRGVAIALAAGSARVMVADRNLGAAEAVADEIANAGGTAVARRADVTSEEDVSKLLIGVEREFGAADVLVHAAGIGDAMPVTDLTLEQWNHILAVNLTGPFLTTRAVLPGMIDQGYGRIILVSSQLAFGGCAGLAHYCATKAGVNGFVKSVAREVAEHGITVNAVAPGPTTTPLLLALPDSVRDAIRAGVPLGRFAEVDEIVPTVELLAGRGGSFYTGAVLSPCGGHAMP